MGIGMERCKKCGAMDMFPNGICSKCGASLEDFPEEEVKIRASAHEKETALSMFAESNEQKNDDSIAEKLPTPETWMYAVSSFLPVLQWLLVSVYVSKGNTKSAFELWWKPFIVQIALTTIAISAVAMFRK